MDQMTAQEVWRARSDEDIAHVIKLGERFVQKAWPYAFNREHAEQYVRMILDQGEVFLSRYGVLAAFAIPLPWNQDVMTVAEQFWYSENQGDGLRLFNEFERWAVEEVQAKVIYVGTIEHLAPRVESFYKRRGYTLRERQFVRNI